MKIYLELIIILILILVFVLWKIWNFISRRIAIKKYNPKNDKSRKGGVFDKGAIRTTEQGTDSELDSLIRPEEPGKREFFQETVTSDVGKNSPSPRKDSKGVRRLFRRK